MKFFETEIPYRIADDITSCNELAPDLVAHVFLLMVDRKDIKDYQRFFARCAYQQWNWYNSEFNKMYGKNSTVDLNEDILSDQYEDTIHNDQYKNHLQEYLNGTPNDVYDWFRRQIALMYIDGMNYREIQKATSINLRYISETINQFKDDVYNSFYSSSD